MCRPLQIIYIVLLTSDQNVTGAYSIHKASSLLTSNQDVYKRSEAGGWEMPIRKKPFPHLRFLLSCRKRVAYLLYMLQLINFPQLLQIYLILLTSSCAYLIKLAASSYISYAKIFYNCCLFCLLLWTSTFYASSKTHIFLLFL